MAHMSSTLLLTLLTRMLLEHKGNDGLGMDTRFGHGCSGDRMLSEHERQARQTQSRKACASLDGKETRWLLLLLLLLLLHYYYYYYYHYPSPPPAAAAILLIRAVKQ